MKGERLGKSISCSLSPHKNQEEVGLSHGLRGALGACLRSWYDGKRKRLDPVGNDPEVALGALDKKRLELAYVAAGGEIKQSDNPAINNGQRKRVSKAVGEYLADCKDRQGKSGYGLAVRTPETYEYRLGFLTKSALPKSFFWPFPK